MGNVTSDAPLYERDPEAWQRHLAEGNEPPLETVRRELKEELGLDLDGGRLLCVDWVSPHGPWDDLLAFIFDGGVPTAEQIFNLRLADDELRAFEFCTDAQLEQRLRPYVARRVASALESLSTRSVQYLQDGWRPSWDERRTHERRSP